MDPYRKAEAVINLIDDKAAFLGFGIPPVTSSGANVSRTLDVLNFLRTVRTHIELMEMVTQDRYEEFKEKKRLN